MIGRLLIRSFALILVLVVGQNVAGQHAPTSAAQLEAMKKLNFLVGEWKGEGWSEMVAGQRRSSPIHESVQPKLGGMILLVEGLGKTKVPGKQEEVVVHNAMGVISYDERGKTYRLRTYLSNGQSTDAEASFIDDAFQWRFQAGPSVKIRYTVKLTDKGEWFEIGEISQDGTNWRKFHEMTLQKVK